MRYNVEDMGSAWMNGVRCAKSGSGNISIQDGCLYSYCARIGQRFGSYAVVSARGYSVTTSRHERIGAGAALSCVGQDRVIRTMSFGPWGFDVVVAELAAQMVEAYTRWNLPQGDEIARQLRAFESTEGDRKTVPHEIVRPRLELLIEAGSSSIFRAWYAWKTAYLCHDDQQDSWVILPKYVGRAIRRNGLTVATVMGTRNAEVRRIGMEALGGWEAIAADPSARLIHRDDFGELYRIGSVTVVKVVNSTPEPDGQFRDYFLEVHPDLRPLPYVPPHPWRTSGFGQSFSGPAPPHVVREREAAAVAYDRPQEPTARNAVASTFGLRGEDYLLAVES